MKSSIPLNVVTDICKHGMGEEQCRYLAMEVLNHKWVCCKITRDHKEIIDEEVTETARKLTESKKSVAELPQGDNCKGFGKLSLPLPVL